MQALTNQNFVPPQPLARWAGLLYVVIAATGISGELILRAPLFSAADPVQALAANLAQFRLSLLSDMIMIVADVTLALVFFQLLRSVSEPLARAAMVFRLMQAALIGVGLILLTAVPQVLSEAPALAPTLGALHATGYDIGLVFFGLNSFVMMALLIRSGGVPRLIATGIGLSGIVYITGGLLRLLDPSLISAFEPAYALPLVAEVSLALWLLIRARI